MKRSFRDREWFCAMTGVLAISLVASFANSSAFAEEASIDNQDMVVIESPADHADVPAVDNTAPAELAIAATAPGEDFEDDPWEGFNEKMFNFNREVLDRFLLKPIATGWDFIFPDMVQRGFRNMFDPVR